MSRVPPVCPRPRPDNILLLTDGLPTQGEKKSSKNTISGDKRLKLADDNTSLWSGDHIVDPAAVPGVLLMNRPFEKNGAKQVDIAPTVLSLFDQPGGELMSGKSLLT